MRALLRARGPLRFALLVVAGGCAGGGAIRLSEVTPQSIPGLEAERNQRPQDPVVLSRLGVAYFKANRYGDARRVLDSAVARDPQSAIAAIYLGMSAEALGDFAAARASFQQSLGVARSGALRAAARQRLALSGRRELEYQARQALAQEDVLAQTPPESNTVAVMPFTYGGTNDQVRPLTRGMAQLVVTDLAKSRQVRVLERERMQAILSEMRLSEEGRADPRTALRSGRMLRAARVVQGTLADRDEELRVDAAVVDVASAGVAASAGVSDQLSRLFDLEKQLVFSLFNNLGIQLSDAEREAINQRPTQNLQAFLAYSRGLEAEDQGDFSAAQQAFTQAAGLDPSFAVAAQSATAAADLSVAAAQSVGDVEAVVVQSEGQESGAAAGASEESRREALREGANQVAPTQTAQAEQATAPSTPPGQRDTTAETTRTEGPRATSGTVIIVIRRPP
ncbi:MAG: tetratricopeptide repeat protein [Gemmatimonadetes bacterium]|nr:tetratricopeptide repeat protein [Gemmatimonadota bacterium]